MDVQHDKSFPEPRRIVSSNMDSTSDDYIPYRGEYLLASSTVATWVLWFAVIQGYASGDDGILPTIIWSAVLISEVAYLVGYWKAVKGKGYSRVLFLVAFTGIIGTLVIFALPDRNAEARKKAARLGAGDTPAG